MSWQLLHIRHHGFSSTVSLLKLFLWRGSLGFTPDLILPSCSTRTFHSASEYFVRNSRVEIRGSLLFAKANKEALWGRLLVALLLKFLRIAAFKWPLSEKRLFPFDFARGFGFDRLRKLVPPRLYIECTVSLLDVLDALLTASLRVFVILKISSTEYVKWWGREVMYSESGADNARRTKARYKSSFIGLTPSLVEMLSSFVLVVIKSLTEPFPW